MKIQVCMYSYLNIISLYQGKWTLYDTDNDKNKFIYVGLMVYKIWIAKTISDIVYQLD